MKFHFAAITFAFFSLASFGGGIDIGVKGGLSYFRSDNDKSFQFYNDYRTGPDITLFCELEQNKLLFHDILVSYYQAGGKTEYTSNTYGAEGELYAIGEKVETDLALDYLGIGYGIKIKPLPFKLSPFISLGMSLDFLINKKEEMKFLGKTEETHSFPYSQLNKFTLRPFSTAGLEFKISKISFLADYTFSYNVIPYYKHDRTDGNIGIKYSSFGSFFSVGCKFDLK